MKGCVGTFKVSSVLPLLMKESPVDVYLDPCAGWGGRYLASFMYGCNYIGYDTNKNLEKCYKKLENFCLLTLSKSKQEYIKGFTRKIHFESCLNNKPFEPFDFCLTSPPYCNLEKYTGMKLWKNWESYYKTFLVPLIIKLKKYAKPYAFIGINVSYKIMKDCLLYLPLEHHPLNQEILEQSMGGKKNKEFIFIFKKGYGL